jgi:hypothetical protein
MQLLIANVLDLVLECCVYLIATAHQVNIVIMNTKRVSALVLLKEICVSQMATVLMDIVAVLMTNNVSQIALDNRATHIMIVLPDNVVMTIKYVKHEIAIQKVNATGNSQSA